MEQLSEQRERQALAKLSRVQSSDKINEGGVEAELPEAVSVSSYYGVLVNTCVIRDLGTSFW